MKKAIRFIQKVFSLTGNTLLYLLILLVVGGLSGLLTFQLVNHFTGPSLGVNNLVILITAFAFFPLLNSFFVIFYIQESKKARKKRKAKNGAILERAE